MAGVNAAVESAIRWVSTSFVAHHGGTVSASYRGKGGVEFVPRLPAQGK